MGLLSVLKLDLKWLVSEKSNPRGIATSGVRVMNTGEMNLLHTTNDQLECLYMRMNRIIE